MIFLAMFGLAIVLMAPLLLVFRRPVLRNRREAALALHRAQLEELARDLDDARIALPEYKAAKLEIERRLLAADGFTAPRMDGNARVLLIGTVVALPIMAFLLYLPGNMASVPSEPHAQWLARQQSFAPIIGMLRTRLAAADPNSVDASQGQAYLAEALSEQAGAITTEALALCKQSLANAPADASWRPLDEQCLTEAVEQ